MSVPSDNLESLNTSQRAAVDWDRGPLLVLAGPGSGKTRVLTLRIARLLAASQRKRFRVLGLTFTNKAAAEMRARVEELIGANSERVMLTTFHSFSAEILRQHGSHVGLTPDFTILTQDADREGVLLDTITRLAAAGEDYSQEDIKLLPALDRLLAECVDVSDAANFFADEDLGHRIQPLYRGYKQTLIESNRLDFASLLLVAHELLIKQPAVAEQLRTVYEHVCVDEFQDTNLAQYRILRALLGREAKHLFVVADDDQIIYQWNGASPERLEALRRDFRMEVVQLPANYRCPPEVIDCANALIQFNLNRSPDKQPIVAVRPSSGNSDTVRLREFPDDHAEAEWIADDIAVHHAHESGRCVVLARTKRLLETIADSLRGAGLEASLTVRKNEFDSRGPVGWLHAALRLANARSDREQLRRMCKAFYEIEGVELDVHDLTALGQAYGGDYLRAFVQAVLAHANITSETRTFMATMEKTLVERLDFLPFIRGAFAWFDVKEREIAEQRLEGFTDYQAERSAWQAIQADVQTKFGADDVTLNLFLQELDLVEKSAPIPPNAVRCLTIHSAKGLEWDHVYIAGLAEEQLPSFQSMKKGPNSKEMQEERRNCFVAITRAQVSLTLTYAGRYSGWSKAPSRFLREMGLL